MAAGRAGMFSIGLLSGGHGPQELFNAGAHRVFDDPADLLEVVADLNPGPPQKMPVADFVIALSKK